MNTSRLHSYFPRILRLGSAVVTVAAAIAVWLHHYFPGVFTWFPVEVQVAVAIGIFGLLADRIFAVHQRVTEPRLSFYETRKLANNALLKIVEKYGAKKIDLLQFSGQTALNFIEQVSLIGKPIQVRVFLVDDTQARRFTTDKDNGEHHVLRIKNTKENLNLINSHNFTYDIFRYPGGSEISAIAIDDYCVSLGWNRSYMDKGILVMKGQDTPAVNALNDHTLLNFVHDQIKKVEDVAVREPK
ncbi:MAG: hypothetical protein ABSB30_06620 [Terracidiphilus sp.]